MRARRAVCTSGVPWLRALIQRRGVVGDPDADLQAEHFFGFFPGQLSALTIAIRDQVNGILCDADLLELVEIQLGEPQAGNIEADDDDDALSGAQDLMRSGTDGAVPEIDDRIVVNRFEEGDDLLAGGRFHRCGIDFTRRIGKNLNAGGMLEHGLPECRAIHAFQSDITCESVWTGLRSRSRANSGISAPSSTRATCLGCFTARANANPHATVVTPVPGTAAVTAIVLPRRYCALSLRCSNSMALMSSSRG